MLQDIKQWGVDSTTSSAGTSHKWTYPIALTQLYSISCVKNITWSSQAVPTYLGVRNITKTDVVTDFINGISPAYFFVIGIQQWGYVFTAGDSGAKRKVTFPLKFSSSIYAAIATYTDPTSHCWYFSLEISDRTTSTMNIAAHASGTWYDHYISYFVIGKQTYVMQWGISKIKTLKLSFTAWLQGFFFYRNFHQKHAINFLEVA